MWFNRSNRKEEPAMSKLLKPSKGGKVIAIANQKGGVGYGKLYILQSP